MRKIETYGTIKGGVLKISYRDKFNSLVKQSDDCRVKLTIEKLYKKRSLNQNAYYHKIICQYFLDGVKQEWGEDHSHDWAHEELKKHCNYSEKTIKNTGELVKVSQSTKTLTTVEFMEYQDRCIKLIGEWFGITVPEPGQQENIFNNP